MSLHSAAANGLAFFCGMLDRIISVSFVKSLAAV